MLANAKAGAKSGKEILYKQTGTRITVLPLNTPEENEFHLYENVSTMFETPMIVYLIFNTFGIIIYALDFKFKGEKGILRLLKISMIFWPFFITFIIIWMLLLMSSFEVKVCTCKYKSTMRTRIKANHKFELKN